jgi:hypothetical protein
VIALGARAHLRADAASVVREDCDMNRWIVAGAAAVVACAACANGTSDEYGDAPDAAHDTATSDASPFADDAAPTDDAAPIDWDATSGGGFDSGRHTYDSGWHDSGRTYDAGTFDASDDATGTDATADASDATASDATVDGSTCGTLVGPSVTASCHACNPGPSCQPNGCYNGYWCDTSLSRCHAPPTTCP